MYVVQVCRSSSIGSLGFLGVKRYTQPNGESGNDPYGGIFCHHMSDNDVDLSDLYVYLSVIYVDLSDHYVQMSEKYRNN